MSGELRRHDAGDGEQRANREVDAAAENHERHPQRDETEHAVLPQHVRQILHRQECFVARRAEDARDDERDECAAPLQHSHTRFGRWR